MRNSTPEIASLKRSLVMLEAVIADGGASSVSALARAVGMPIATAHRQVATLVTEGYLTSTRRGGHIAGPRLLDLLRFLDEKQIITNVAAPILHQLATDLSLVVQLGTLENEMVTYRIKTGDGAGELFTRVGMQLEAYCSGIGKVLIAHLPRSEQLAYLATGPFVPLTSRTIVDPERLSAEFERVLAEGFACDDGEISEGLRCLAVPICNNDGGVSAAISISQAGPPFRYADDDLLPPLRNAKIAIEHAAFGRAP